MKKFLLFFLIAASFTMSAGAQVLCGFDTKMDQLKKANPAYARELESTEQYIRSFVASQPLNAKKASVTYTIPVVVHVMHTGDAVGTIYNPTDAQIISTIDYINEVYAGTYAGLQEPVEGGGVVNMELKFVLAKRTAGCGFTNGIERVDASSIPNYVANGVNSQNSNGATDLQVKNFSRWDPSQYYNIWVVNKIDGKDGTSGQFTAGYAYFAGAPASLDGTVMIATQMKAGQKTLPHELGHAFNLYHTFQGSNLNTACPVNTNCNTNGDGVCDTDPVTNNVNSEGVYNFNCRTGVNTCTSTNYTRNTESNFMAYTNCSTLFTNGQKARVQAAMTLPGRASLIASQGATYCGTGINFNIAADAKTEDKSGTTTGCRTYRDYTYHLNIGEAPSAPATVTFSYSGTATKGLDYEVTTNSNFTSPSDVLTFASGVSTPKTFTVRIYDDANAEPAETAIINFSVNTTGNATVGTMMPTFTLTINDNDRAPVAYNTNSYQVGAIKYSIQNPFNSANINQRGQFLYKASELLAAGITAGPMGSMQLQVYTKATTGTFENFNMRIGTSTADYLYDGGGFLGSGFTTVYTNPSFTTAAGWNTFPFSTPFVWDGTSNIVVEYCYSSVTGTGVDAIAAYSDGGAEAQYNYLYQSGIDCATQFSSVTGFSTGVKPLVKFGMNITGTQVETTTAGTHTEYLNAGSNDYFYSNTNKIIAKIGSVDEELGCVQVSVENAGTEWQPFLEGYRSAKVFNVTPTTNGSTTGYTISLYLAPEELNGKDPATLKIAKTSAASIAEANAANTVLKEPVLTMVGPNIVLTASFTGFSRFFVVDNAVLLPVTLVSFTGKMNESSEAMLNWKVSQQQNLNGFEVERSANGQAFSAIGFVAAQQGTASLADYNFTDKGAGYGLNYYRLKMTDNDGKFSFSQVIKIVKNGTVPFVTLMSNPVKEAIGISVNKNSPGNIGATLYNAVGAKVASWQLGNSTGNIQLPIGQYQLVPGVYLLKVSNGSQVETLKVLKK